ncbi:MAG: plasmid pRiA4b ORF-3 family protein [Silvanigrellales bacterium]|nr:plasmid pRiA4b ORF-3 family protein [Silvanigrellales bacterium]
MVAAGKKAAKVGSKKTQAKPQSAATKQPKGVAELVEMKVTLEEVKPAVVRKLIVSTRHSLDELHDIIQTAMGWQDCHLHAFQIPGTRESFGKISTFDGGEDLENEEDFSIRDLLARGVKKLRYTYDFGDDWEHTIAFGKTVSATPGTRYPLCIAGQGACPPEDCGGPWGYAEKMEILSDPKHEDYEETREWMESIIVPDHFSVDEVNARLHPLPRAARRGPAKATKNVAKSEGKKSTKTSKIPSNRSKTPTSSEPFGTTFTTPSGLTVTRFTAGDFIEVKPGLGFDGKVKLPINSNPSFEASSFFLGQIPPSIRKIDVYTEPIPSTWGTKKMSSFCKEELNLKTTQGRAFLFFNSKRNMLRVYWHDGESEQLLESVLFQGAFLVPLTGKSGPWMQVARDTLPKLLKASPGKKSPSPIRK